MRRLVRNRDGGIAVEFALIIPIMVALLLGGVDIVRFVIINQKMDRVAGFIGDFVARERSLDESNFDEFFAAAQHIAKPYDLESGGILYISGIGGGPGDEHDDAEVLWQRAGAGTLSQSSSVGEVGDAPTLPAGLPVAEGQGLIVTEIFYRFDPLFVPNIVAGRVLQYRVYHRPRLVDLLDVGT